MTTLAERIAAALFGPEMYEGELGRRHAVKVIDAVIADVGLQLCTCPPRPPPRLGWNADDNPTNVTQLFSRPIEHG